MILNRILQIQTFKKKSIISNHRIKKKKMDLLIFLKVVYKNPSNHLNNNKNQTVSFI